MIDVVLADGSEGSIVIDPGAVECVMPKDMLASVTTLRPKEGMRITTASASELGNYILKLIEFTSRSETHFTRQA